MRTGGLITAFSVGTTLIAMSAAHAAGVSAPATQNNDWRHAWRATRDTQIERNPRLAYEPYLSSVRAAPQAGRIIATTLDYPMVMDTFGCTPKFLKENPAAAKALADSYFEALDMIAREPARSTESTMAVTLPLPLVPAT